MLVADYCDIKGKTWLVTADRFFGWVTVHYFPREASSKGLIKVFGDIFITFGVPQEVTTDSGPQFISHELASLLEKGGEKHRRSSPYNPHADLRAETAVKTAKRIPTSNTKSDGSPNWDDVKRALLQHRNTPLQDLAISPAQMLFGRAIRDHLPVKPGLFKPSEVWITTRDQRELALRHRISVGKERQPP